MRTQTLSTLSDTEKVLDLSQGVRMLGEFVPHYSVRAKNSELPNDASGADHHADVILGVCTWTWSIECNMGVFFHYCVLSLGPLACCACGQLVNLFGNIEQILNWSAFRRGPRNYPHRRVEKELNSESGNNVETYWYGWPQCVYVLAFGFVAVLRPNLENCLYGKIHLRHSEADARCDMAFSVNIGRMDKLYTCACREKNTRAD